METVFSDPTSVLQCCPDGDMPNYTEAVGYIEDAGVLAIGLIAQHKLQDPQVDPLEG